MDKVMNNIAMSKTNWKFRDIAKNQEKIEFTKNDTLIFISLRH